MEFLNKFNLDEIYLLYEYFWLTFWLGEELSEKMLIKQNLNQIYRAFLSHDEFIDDINSLINYQKQKDYESRNIINKNNQIYVNSINNFYSQLKDIYDQSLISENNFDIELLVDGYNYLIDVINEDNIFDDEVIILYSLLNPKITSNLFKLMCEIFKICYSNDKLENINLLDNKNKLSNKQIKKIGAYSSIGAITIIILVVVFVIVF